MLCVQGDVRVTALKTAEDGKGVVVRMHNVGDTAADWSLGFAKPIAAAYYADVHENKLAAATVSENAVVGTCAPYAICTVLVELQ